MRTFEVDGALQQLSANGASQVFIQFGVVLVVEGKWVDFSFGKEIEDFEGLVLDDVLFIFVHG